VPRRWDSTGLALLGLEYERDHRGEHALASVMRKVAETDERYPHGDWDSWDRFT
jgi:hypothetical protein